jgi:pseudouridine-5'-phosphate glycosidase/pseudouridine kinase
MPCQTQKTHPVPAFTVPQSHSSTPPATLATSSDPLPQPKVVIFGSAAIDITAKASPSSSSILHTTALGQISYTAGGVGRNIAECSTKLLPPGSVVMVSAIGSSSLTGEAGTSEADAFGAMLINEMSGVGMRTDGLVLREGMGTGVCNLILGNEGGLVAGVADMDVVETVTENEVSRRTLFILQRRVVR